MFDTLYQHDLPEIVTHWTSAGVFRLQAGMVSGSLCWELYLDDDLLATYLNPYHAARDLNAGRLDEEIGFQANGLSIPFKLEDWNDLE